MSRPLSQGAPPLLPGGRGERGTRRRGWGQSGMDRLGPMRRSSMPATRREGCRGGQGCPSPLAAHAHPLLLHGVTPSAAKSTRRAGSSWRRRSLSTAPVSERADRHGRSKLFSDQRRGRAVLQSSRGFWPVAPRPRCPELNVGVKSPHAHARSGRSGPARIFFLIQQQTQTAPAS